MSEHDQSNQEEKQYDWAKNAENAAKKAENEVDKLKEEARKELRKGKDNFNNPD